ncbi:hypothetical protein AMK22_35475 [Streptomyces sp. CB01580]|nr:hypothetical protein AMK22_35475 [Streptomyces sp. CB01580]
MWGIQRRPTIVRDDVQLGERESRRQEPVSSPVSTSAGPTFLRRVRSDSDFMAARTGRPSWVAP